MNRPSPSAWNRLRGFTLRRYLQLVARRDFTHCGNRIRVGHGVLNPTLFRASLVFADQAVDAAPEAPAKVLELGCGTGLAACALARRGHCVTAVDISLRAAFCCQRNARSNGLQVRVIAGSWGDALRSPAFDYIVCNPPFLAAEPQSLSRALWAGPNGDWLTGSIEAVARLLHPSGRALLMTSEHTDRHPVLDAFQSLGLTHRTTSHRLHGETLVFDELQRAEAR